MPERSAQFAIGHLIGEKSGRQFGTMLNTVLRDAAVIRIHATERYPKKPYPLSKMGYKEDKKLLSLSESPQSYEKGDRERNSSQNLRPVYP